MVEELRNEQKRTFVPIIAGIFIVGMVLLGKYFFEGIVYTFMLIFGLIILIFFKQILVFFGVRAKMEEKLYGVGKNPIQGIFLGLAFGIVFLVLTKIKILGSVVSMAVPQVPLSISGQGLITIVVAPICEEIFFSLALLSILSLFLPFFWAVILKSIGFSAYHFFAYTGGTGDISVVAGSFIGAFIFGMVGGYLAKYIGLEASISGHGFFNGWQFNSVYPLFTVIS